MAKISELGRDGDDEALYDKPEFYERMHEHELERGKTRHDSPALFSKDDAILLSDVKLSSSRKRVKLSHSALIESFIETQEKRHVDIISVINKK